MAELKIPVQINGFDLAKKVVQDFINNIEFGESMPEEYKEGFRDCSECIVRLLEQKKEKVDEINAQKYIS